MNSALFDNSLYDTINWINEKIPFIYEILEFHHVDNMVFTLNDLLGDFERFYLELYNLSLGKNETSRLVVDKIFRLIADGKSKDNNFAKYILELYKRYDEKDYYKIKLKYI